MCNGLRSRNPRSDQPFSFAYQDFEFFCSAEPIPTGVSRPTAVLTKAAGGGPTRFTLPADTDEIGYATKQEALRHAEQQALRWVHDRTGTGQAGF